LLPPNEAGSLDPLADALARKARTGAAGAAEGRTVAAGDGWRVVDVVCTSGPGDRSFEERQPAASISLVLTGTFTYRSDRGVSLMSSGSMLLGNAGHAYECSHRHGEGDRCLSFQFAPEVFERVAYDAGVRRPFFDVDRLPPLRPLAPLAARADRAAQGDAGTEELALELAAAVLFTTARAPAEAPAVTAADAGRVARVLRLLETHTGDRLPLAELARVAGLSRFHFLRTFKRVTGVTPHQWVLRARLRDAAALLAGTTEPVTQVALGVGFEDLSNFVRSFRAEFGMSPSRYRASG
jgi:AraC-like DNA-binding protein